MSQIDENELVKCLKEKFGFDSFKGNQKEVIECLMEGNDTFVLMPTGGGKSLCYQLPAIMLEGTAIVISPLIALMKNQVDAMRGFSTDNRIAHFLNSSLSRSEVTQVKDDVRQGITKLLYVAPESLTKEDSIEFFRTIKISFFAIDEAHCISEWGHDFRPEYRRIRPIVEAIGRAPIIALTATATPKVQHDIQKNLGMLDAKVFKSSFRRKNLYYEIRPQVDATKQIIKFIRENPGKSGIIYCLSRKKVEELANTLIVNGIKALPYHAGLDAHTRSKNQDMFLMEEVDVIVATIAFGMGIDKPMCGLLYIIIYRNRSKAIIRKRDARDATAEKADVSHSTAIRIFFVLKNLWKESLWPNRKLENNCCSKLRRMRSQACAACACCLIILAKQWTRTAATATTVCIRSHKLRPRTMC